jgi:Putative polyhydroxyalkanoic acid system protein (PHA_gran_rgn)
MRIAIPHHTTKANARQKVEERFAALIGQFGGHAQEVEHQWAGDTLNFKGKARGFALSGTMEVTDAEVIVEGKLPFLAMPFEPKIREAVKKEVETMFQRA